MNPVNPPAIKSRPKNWLLIKFREWHIWLGVAMSLFILTVCFTGIYLNHKDLFHTDMGAVKKMNGSSGKLTTASHLEMYGVSFVQALAKAKSIWGDIPIEHIQLKDERGMMIYKIKAGEGREIIVDAASGVITEKNDYHEYTRSFPGFEGKKSYNWDKIFIDLHTGKLWGDTGKLVVDLTSIVIIGLTITGIYLWIVPKWRKRQAAKMAAAQVMK